MSSKTKSWKLKTWKLTTWKLKTWSHRFLSAALLAGFLFALCSSGRVDAQTNAAKAIIEGNVADAAGAAVPGAQLRVAPIGITGVSNDQGGYRLPEVPAGKYTLTVSYVGFSPQSYDIEVTAGQTLNLDLKLKVANASEAILVSASRPHGEAEAVNETRTADNLQQVMPSEVIMSLPNANVTRYGFDGSTDYRLTDNTSVYAHGFYSDLKDWGDKWYYQPISAPITGTAADPIYPTASTKGSAPKFYTSSKRPNASVGTLILGGRTVHNDSLFTYQISASRSYEVDSAGNPKADFSWVGPTEYCNYIPSQQIGLYHPHFGNCDNTGQSPLLNAANWQFKDITISKGKNAQLNLTAQTTYAKSYSWGGHFGTFETGFKFTNAHQNQDSTESVYDSFGSSAPLMTQLLDTFHNTDYFSGNYFGGHYGQVSNFNDARDYTLANYQGDLDLQKTAADIYPNLFHTVEQITAGFVMNNIDFGKLHVNTGLRIESTRDLTFGYNLTFWGSYSAKTGTYAGGASEVECAGNAAPIPPAAGNCYTAIGTNNNPAYIDFLPSVDLRYRITENSALRGVFSRGVARPDPYQLVPYVEEDSTASPVAVTIGNPSLRPEHANNYDLLYEDYLQPLGLLQAGFFFKQITAPQVQITLPGGLSAQDFPAGYFPPSVQTVLAEYPGDAITQYSNGQNAYIYGFELSFQQHFGYLPGVLKGLGISANYSYTASQEKGLPLRNDHPTTIDQAPNTWKLSPTYDTNRFSARVGLAYDQASLFSYDYVSPAYVTGADPSGLGPSGPSGDIFTLTHFQVDAQASYRFYKGLRAVVSGLNLNNEVFGYYQGNTPFVNQREFYKPTYTAGLRYTLGER